MQQPNKVSRLIYLFCITTLLTHTCTTPAFSHHHTLTQHTIAVKHADTLATRFSEDTRAAEEKARIRQLRKELRQDFFVYTQGLSTLSTTFALHTSGILDLLITQETITMQDIVDHIADINTRTDDSLHSFVDGDTVSANVGYLHIAMATMAKMDWLTRHGPSGHHDEDESLTMQFRITDAGKIAFTLARFYEPAALFLPTAARMNDYLAGDRYSDTKVAYDPALVMPKPKITLDDLLNQRDDERGIWGIPENGETLIPGIDQETYAAIRAQIIKHIDGLIMSALSEEFLDCGIFKQCAQNDHTLRIEDIIIQHPDRAPTSDAPIPHTPFQGLRDAAPMLDALHFFALFGFFEIGDDTFTLTEKGMQLAGYGYDEEADAIKKVGLAGSYGVPVAYNRTTEEVFELFFGNEHILSEKKDTNFPNSTREGHIWRRKNVNGSGTGHRNYFVFTDTLIRAVFNLPLEEQPKYVMDIGGGDGSFLTRVHTVATDPETVRGKALRDDPKKMETHGD